jgi:acetoin utilization protein AcuB
MPGRTVGDYMTRDVVTLLDTDTLRAAVELELRRKVRHMPVLDAHGALVGIVTDRDIKRALPTPLSPPTPDEYEYILDATHVGKVMTREPYTVGPGTPIADAIEKLLDQKIGGLPVVEGGALVGMFTQSDALRAFLALLKETD